MAAPSYFPLMVEGSWGPDPPKSLITKLQLYFQSQKRSGGGECEVRQEPGSTARFLVLFHPHDVRQNVLKRENHELALPGKGTFKLTVKLLPDPNEVHDVSKEKIPAKESKAKEHAKEPDASEDTQISLNKRSEKMEDIPKQCENIPSLVAFENLKANVTDIMLTLLVENISGLSSDDFEVEVIRDFDVGVVTFRKYIDAMKFVEDCAMHHSVTQLQLSPRLLEMTKIIRVENLPPGVDSYDLKCLFENPQNGGGRVVSIECFPEESSALIEFFDRKDLAAKRQYQSIAIPAISSGDGGFPLSQCVETIVLAIKETFQYNWAGCTLKEVYLVDLAEKTVEAFAETVKTVFKNNKPGTACLPSVPAGVQPGPRNTDGNRQMLLCPGGLRILLVKGDVQNAVADVVVNSIPRDLNLNSGPLSQALLAKAGPNLQKELNAAAQGIAVDVGTILQTTGQSVSYQVLHVVAPNWNNGDTSSLKIMQDIIRKCLEMTENLSLNSIAFPAIGTGNLGFPKTVFAELIISEVFKFSSNNQPTALQEVCFLLHPSDHGNIQAFSDEFDRRANGNSISDRIPKAQNTQGLYGTVTSPASGVYEMKIGPITFQVATGDIAKEAADVIVNSTTKTFDHKAGVSKAILEKAGQNVETECSRLAQQHNNGYIITDGGSLKCKNIIHVVGGADVKRSVTRVLRECEKRNHSTICLPAIGTGLYGTVTSPTSGVYEMKIGPITFQVATGDIAKEAADVIVNSTTKTFDHKAEQDPDKVAEAIMDAIEDFIQKGLVRSMKKVKVVIFQPQIMDVFFANMRKREGSQAPSQSIMSKIASFLGFSKQPPPKRKPLVLEKKMESAIFQVCGENETSVQNALYCLQNLMEKEQSLYTSEEECIKDFDEKEYQELNKLQKDLNILVELDHQKPLIKVSGISRDVEQARNAVEEMIKTVRSAKEQESRADYITEFVEWQYDDNNTYRSFDKITNMKLEEARKKREETVDVLINNQNYTVDMKTCIATGANGHSLQIQRITKPQ
ncbi:PREDICTED: LOW QUALITY PROTEIN: poly [ADP-ribose] polymerase 14-like, partial [Myotis brandtii]|uniref:LOW QUALITY PROTEIN: poly [ADP-ribose] polymerase 14-like n=1 Tax=Myotis brandtii TaxID=109478 RepID=UPI0007046D44